MATYTPKLLATGTLTGAGPDITYTVPASTKAIINHVFIKNKHATLNRLVKVTAGVVASENEWADLDIKAKKHAEFNGVFILEASQNLLMDCVNGTDVDYFICGVEET